MDFWQNHQSLEIMPITNGILKMTFSVCAMLTMSKISHIQERCENKGFQGSRFYGNVCNIASSNFHEFINPLFY